MGKRERSVKILNEEYLVEAKPQENLEYKKKLVSRNALNDIVLTEKQKDLLQEFEANDITIVSGPAGSAKTWSACYYAVQCLKTNKFDKIIFTKPIREAGEQLGFLPGDIKDKIDPHYESFRQNILKMIDKQTLLKNYERGVFEDKPLAYLRGQSIDFSLLILDEAQNCDIRDLMMFVTRMGKNSKVIICGDVSQHDIKYETVAIPYFEKLISDIPGVSVFKFTDDDIMRNGILKEITRRYEREKAEGKIPKMKK